LTNVFYFHKETSFMTRWKYDISYRHPIYSALKKPSFRLGCKQGVACCACCSALMTTQLILGIMNPLVMVVVAIVIAAEKLLPRLEITARVSGVAAVVAGITQLLKVKQHLPKTGSKIISTACITRIKVLVKMFSQKTLRISTGVANIHPFREQWQSVSPPGAIAA
jgi:hypothetical protein